MCCIHGICILAPGANVSANMIFHPVKPFAIYADFESRLVKEDIAKSKSTTQVQRHIPAAYCYHMVSDIDPADNVTIQYTAETNDENVPSHFIKSLSETVNRLAQRYAESKPMIITDEEQASFDVATTCWICGGEIVDDDENLRKVRDHCHFTGKYRGAAHNKCNLRLRRDKSVPVLFHNGKGYDFHLFMRDLGRIPGKISVIAKNEEQYISITKNIIVSEGNAWRLRFLDSCGFLQASLDAYRHRPFARTSKPRSGNLVSQNYCSGKVCFLTSGMTTSENLTRLSFHPSKHSIDR